MVKYLRPRSHQNRNSRFYRYFGTNLGENAQIRNKRQSYSGTAVSAGEVVYCSGLGLVPEQNAVGTQLVQEIAAVVLVTSDNFLPKIFNNWLCDVSNCGNGQQTS